MGAMAALVVLVRTHSPGNLGSAARACKCFGAELALLHPSADRGHADARAYASGAEDVLERALELPDLDAVRSRADRLCALTSMRGRVARSLPPLLRWSALRGRAEARVALVFGPERGGLTNDELALCDGRLRIATQPSFPTLNVAQSVAVALALLATDRSRVPSDGGHATSAELARVRAALVSTLEEAGFTRGPIRTRARAELETTLLRARLTSREASLWLGALAALARSSSAGKEPRS